MEKVDITIIGAGIIGLAASYKLSDLDKDIFVVEKNMFIGQETSSRNSEVIHAGIYYPPESLKANCCIEGKQLLYQLCKDQNIPHKKLGKLLVACNDEEYKKLKNIQKNAENSGVNNLTFLEKSDYLKLEPNIEAAHALWCPDTGIIDSHRTMKFFHDYAKDKGTDIACGIEVINIQKFHSHYVVTVKEPQGDHYSFQTEFIINAAGFSSDKIAEMVGIDTNTCGYKIHLCKGQYFRLSEPQKFNINHLIYPPPSRTDLGIHITPDLAGGLRLGPDAEYVDHVSYDIHLEDKEKFFKSVGRFLKGLQLQDLIPDTVGIRSKLQAPDDGFKDFVIANETEKGFSNFINLIGIESPGLTACLSIANKVKNFVK